MSNNLKCVIFCGWRGSGKDTFADYLVKNKGFIKFSFASKLKDMCVTEYGVNRTDFDDRKLKEQIITNIKSKAYDKSPRDLCINMAKKYRDINPDFWVEFVMESMNNFDEKIQYVISDCRYPNELVRLREKYQCLVVWINRWKKPPSLDPSELSLSSKNCDVTLDNTGSLKFDELNRIMNIDDYYLKEY